MKISLLFAVAGLGQNMLLMVGDGGGDGGRGGALGKLHKEVLRNLTGTGSQGKGVRRVVKTFIKRRRR